MSQKIGFWSVLALVIGSQLGSGVFMLPVSLAPFGKLSITGWLISSGGALALALVFANLCSLFPKTGGPHVYVQQAFGQTIAFFTGWTYWVVSWISTTTVVIAAIAYLGPFTGQYNATNSLSLELLLLLFMSCLNLYSVTAAGKAETVFTALKFLPLFIIPAAALWFFDSANFFTAPAVEVTTLSTNLAQVTLLTLWGFIGLESATTPAGSVERPAQTIPKAIIIGTVVVAAVYLFNSIALMGLIPGNELQHSSAPYVEATQRIFGGNWHLAVATAASIVCMGTLNAWILTSGQISLGLAEDGLMPAIFYRRNRNGAPYLSVLCSFVGIASLLIMTASESIAQQISKMIDFSVTSFLFVYLACSLANLVISLRTVKKWSQVAISGVAMLFCGWIIYETPAKTLLVAGLFTVSGLPLYLFWYRRNTTR